jgi:hypothetical protein
MGSIRVTEITVGVGSKVHWGWLSSEREGVCIGDSVIVSKEGVRVKYDLSLSD